MYKICYYKGIIFSENTISQDPFLKLYLFCFTFDSMKFTKMKENAIKHLTLAIQNAYWLMGRWHHSPGNLGRWGAILPAFVSVELPKVKY